MIYDRWVIVLLCFYEYLDFIFLVNLLLHEDAVQFLNFRQEGKKRSWEFKGLHDAFSEILTLVQKSGGTFDLTWRVLQQALIICTVNRRGEACTCKVWHVGVPGFWSPPAVCKFLFNAPMSQDIIYSVNSMTSLNTMPFYWNTWQLIDYYIDCNPATGPAIPILENNGTGLARQKFSCYNSYPRFTKTKDHFYNVLNIGDFACIFYGIDC